MRATIKDVARLAGFSIATVSMVLNNKPVPISQETKDIIIKTANELQYTPNQLAVGLVTQKTNTLGLIIPDNSNLFFAAYSNKIEIAASDLGYNVIFGNTNNDAEKSFHYLQIFADRKVDGIILAQSEFPSPKDTEACMALIKRLKVPVILIDRVSGQPGVAHVHLDHLQGGYIATKYLLDLGHKRIGFITGPMGLTYCRERLLGCHQALKEAGVDYDPSLEWESDLSINGGIEALPYLLGKNVSAICAFNDMMAFGVYKQARYYNLTIPDDLSVIGFDDIFFSDIISPPLTTVMQPLEEMAAAAVSRLVSVIQNKVSDDSKSQVFQPVLKVRGSIKKYDSLAKV